MGGCIGHGVQVCSPLLLVHMMLALWSVPTGNLTLASLYSMGQSPLSRRSSLSTLRWMSADTASSDELSGILCTTPLSTSGVAVLAGATKSPCQRGCGESPFSG